MTTPDNILVHWDGYWRVVARCNAVPEYGSDTAPAEVTDLPSGNRLVTWPDDDGRAVSCQFECASGYDPEAVNHLGRRGAYVDQYLTADDVDAAIARIRRDWGPLPDQRNRMPSPTLRPSGLLPVQWARP